MHTSRRILIGIIAVLVIGAGLVTGTYLSRDKPITQASLQVPEKIKPNFNTYDISPTSRGAVLIAVDVTFNVADDNAIASLSQTDATDVKTGQRVLLYNTHGDILEKLGTVEKVAVDGMNGRVNITVKLDQDKVVANDLVTKAKIVTGDIPNAPRLPLTALIEKDGVHYIWEVSTNQDGTHSAYFKPVDISRKTESFIVINESTGSSNIFVLNPDAALRDGQTINVNKILYAGPELTEEGRVMVMIKKRQRILVDEETKSLLRINMPVRPLPTPSINSCNPQAKITSDFIMKIKNISVQEEIKRRAARREARQEMKQEKELSAKPELQQQAQ